MTEHKRSVINIENCWSKWQVIASQESIASQIHRESSVSVINTFDQTQNQSGSGASVTVCGMSGTEGPEPAGTDPIDLKLPRGAAGSSRVPTTEQAAPKRQRHQ